MTLIEWSVVGAVWMLIPLGLLLKELQDVRFRRWQREDNENIVRHFKDEDLMR